MLAIDANARTALLLTVQSEAVVGTGEDLASPTERHLFVEIILQYQSYRLKADQTQVLHKSQSISDRKEGTEARRWEKDGRERGRQKKEYV